MTARTPPFSTAAWLLCRNVPCYEHSDIKNWMLSLTRVTSWLWLLDSCGSWIPTWRRYRLGLEETDPVFVHFGVTVTDHRETQDRQNKFFLYQNNSVILIWLTNCMSALSLSSSRVANNVNKRSVPHPSTQQAWGIDVQCAGVPVPLPTVCFLCCDCLNTCFYVLRFLLYLCSVRYAWNNAQMHLFFLRSYFSLERIFSLPDPAMSMFLSVSLFLDGLYWK